MGKGGAWGGVWCVCVCVCVCVWGGSIKADARGWRRPVNLSTCPGLRGTLIIQAGILGIASWTFPSFSEIPSLPPPPPPPPPPLVPLPPPPPHPMHLVLRHWELSFDFLDYFEKLHLVQPAGGRVEEEEAIEEEEEETGAGRRQTGGR